ncbi:hypothetical protein RN001_009152 [Aquatica leii]|uniref:Ionotropic glutamate receptor C-terminal domain-containing protein n=1 Tax=Aquatica leii TaxID=1421715 RepID=A0AAN7S815_9COLE|nr:hypothetical protein RN001_009152 [Aquatica leii]
MNVFRRQSLFFSILRRTDSTGSDAGVPVEKGRVKSGIRILNATPSETTSWNISVEINPRHTGASVTALRKEAVDSEDETSSAGEVVELFTWLIEVTEDAAELYEGARVVWSMKLEPHQEEGESPESHRSDGRKSTSRLDVQKDDIQAVVPISKILKTRSGLEFLAIHLRTYTAPNLYALRYQAYACVSKSINQMFNEDDTLAFIYDEYVKIEIPKIMKHPYVIARCTGLTKSKLDRSAAYIVHLQKQELLNNTLTFLRLSSFWIHKQSPNGRYLVIINENHSQDIQKIFTFFWNLKIHKVVVITQHNHDHQIHTSNPYDKKNYCGAYANIIRSQYCNGNFTINILKNYTDINKCSITFITHDANNYGLKTFFEDFFNELAKKTNGEFIKNTTVTSKAELISFMIQPMIVTSIATDSSPYIKEYDFSNTVIVNKIVIVVKAGDTISPVKILFVIFKTEVWIMIIVSIGITSLSLWFISSIDKQQFNISKFGKTWLDVLLATIWGYFVLVPKNIKARYIIICYLVYQIHIQTGFTSNLVTILTTPRYEPGIKNLEDLVQSNLSIIASRIYEEFYFSRAETSNNIYSKIKNQMLFIDLQYNEMGKLLNYRNCAMLMMEMELGFVKFEVGGDIHVNRIATDLVTGNVRSSYVLSAGHFFTKTLNSFIRSMEESVITQHNHDHQIHTSNPYDEKNYCGAYANIIRSQYCNGNFTINILKNYTNINKCSITFITSDENNYGLKAFFEDFFNTLAEKTNGEFIKNTTVTSKAELISFMIQPIIVTSIATDSSPYIKEYDFSNTVIVNKIVIVVKARDTISPVKTLFVIFRTEVWIMIILSIGITSLSLWLISSIDKQQFSISKFGKTWLDVLLATIWGYFVLVPRNIKAHRYIIISYLVYQIHIQTGFTSNLVTVLTTPQYKPGIQNLEDLVESNLSIIAPRHIEEFYFSRVETSNNIYSKIKNQMRFIDLSYIEMAKLLNYRNCAMLMMELELQVVKFEVGGDIHVNSIETDLVTGNIRASYVLSAGHFFTKTLNSFIRKIDESDLSYIEMAKLLNYRNCAMLMMELELQVVKFEVGGDIHVNSIETDLVTGNIHASYLLTAGHFFTKTLNSVIRSIDESDACVSKYINQIFNEDDTLAFIYDKYVKIEVPKIMKRPYVIARSTSPTTLKLDRSAGYIMHLAKQELIVNTTAFLNSSTFWIPKKSPNERYLVIINNTNFQDLKKIFTFFWSLKIHKVIVFTQHRTYHDTTIKIHTSNPFHKENSCGTYANVISSQDCNSNFSLNFFKKYTDINKCPITYLAVSVDSKNFIAFIEDFFNVLAEKTNGSFVIKIVGTNKANILSIMMQPIIATIITSDNSPYMKTFDFSHTILANKLLIVVKAGDQISPVNILLIIFKKEVWIMIIVSIGITTSALWVMSSLDKKRFCIFNLGETCLDVFLATIWGYFMTVPKNIKARYIIICYLVYQIHIQTGFSSNLVTVLTTPQYKPGIQNLEDLIESNLPIVASPACEKFYFSEAETSNNIYSKIKNQMRFIDLSYIETAKLLNYRNCAMLMMELELQVVKFEVGGDIHVNSIATDLITGNVHACYLLSSGHFFTKTLNSVIRRLDESDYMSIYFGMFLNGLAEKVNGTFIIKYVKNRTEVQDTIMQLHIGLATTVINSNFLKISDFSQIVLSNKLVIVVKKGEAVSQVKILFIIFKLEVWIMIIISIGITSLALWFILSMQEKRFSATKFGEIWLNVYLATIWGYFAPVLKNTKAQYICICYLIYQIHIQTGFTSNLVTVLTTPQYQPGITNLEELVESKLPVLAPISMEYFYFSDVGEPNSIYRKIKNQMRYNVINLPQKEVAELLNYRNCTMLLMDLEVEDLKFVVGGDLHVNVIGADAVTGNVHAVFVMAPGHFFKETLNSFISSIDESVGAYQYKQLESCVSKIINQVFSNNETLVFIYDESVDVELPNVMTNPYVIARCTKPTSLKFDGSTAYILHLQNQELLNNTLTYLKSSAFWIFRKSLRCLYLIIINERNVQDVEEVFKSLWNMKIYRVAVLTYHNSKNRTTIKVHTSNPFHEDNHCGAYANVIYSQNCNNYISINFSKKYTNLNKCNITRVTPNPHIDYMSIYFGMFLNGLAEKVNGTFIIKYVKNRTEVQDTIMQLHIGLATTGINSNFLKISDFSQIVLSNKLVIVVKKGEAVSQVKILFIIFKLEVWIMIIISIGITSFALWFILSMQEKRFSATKFGEIWLNVYLATIWGYFAPVLKNTKAQYICICYLIYQIHIQTGFTSNLVTVLTTPQYQPGITNLEELVESKLPILAPISMEYFYFSDVGEPNSIYRKIKNQMRYNVINLPQKEVAELLNYRNCTMLLMDLEVEDLKFVVGGDLHVNVIGADAVTGNVHAVFVMAPGHFFQETLNSFISSIDESGITLRNVKSLYDQTKIKPKFKKLVPLNLKHLSSAFVFLLFGLTTASVVFVIEMVARFY